MMKFQGFPSDTISFLEDLRENNNRPWFAENKERYEASLLTPALQLIASLEKPLAKVAPLLRVEAKKVGGSLMRIYKDTRFSADKTPYKTNLGIQFRHQAGKDVHAPGVYLHVDPQEAFLAVGTWRPPSEALKKIRGSIVEHEANWRRLLKAKRFNDSFTLYEDRLKTAPRGFARTHPMIDLLRQRSYIGIAPLSPQQLHSPELLTLIPQLVGRGRPLMVALCEALEQVW